MRPQLALTTFLATGALLCGAGPATAQFAVAQFVAAQMAAAPPAAVQPARTQPSAIPSVATRSSTIPAWARVSFFAQAATTTQAGGVSTSFTELVTNISAESARSEASGFEYGVNVRYAGYPSSNQQVSRVSVYDAYVGQRLLEGNLLVRVGSLWLNDLGALGSVGGMQVEYHKGSTTKGTRVRFGLFGGVEPKILEAGYLTDIKKVGGYVAVESSDMRRHAIGYVSVRNQGLVERSVVSLTNYVPVKKRLFVYQVAEFDLAGPGGQGKGGLTYFFTNARLMVTDAIEIQGLIHRGRSVDVRSITDDMRNGRPVNPKSLDGLLYESTGGRLTVRLFKNLRVFGGYTRDKNNRDDNPTDRFTFGLYSSNVLRTGIDLNVTDNRMRRGTAAAWDSWYVSLGRSFGNRVYVTGDYSTSLSVLQFVRFDGIIIETRPNTKRFGLSGMVNLGRLLAVQFTGEHTKDDSYSENRILAGLVFRF